MFEQPHGVKNQVSNPDKDVMDSFLQQFDLPAEEFADFLPDGELLAVPLVVEEKNSDNSGPGGPVPSPSLDFNDNEDIPTELSDSSETHDEGTGRPSASFTYRPVEGLLRY